MRLRFRLDGGDPVWRDLPASGRALLQFVAADGAMIGGEQALFPGESPGWTGLPETSEFVPQELSAVAPPGTTGVVFSILSHNAEQVVGSIAIDDVILRVDRAGESAEARPLTPLEVDEEALSGRTNPRGWIRPGTRPDMSLVRTRRGPAPHPVLVIVDDDPTRFGNWSTAKPNEIEVRPGDRVTASWTAAHSFGIGGTAAASYPALTAGTYWFRVATFTAGGEATGDEASLSVVVVPPWHMRRDVWVAAAAAAAVGLLLAGRAIATRRLARRLEELERSHALERERSRIARDLHDEIGAKLTEIAMRADTVRSEVDGIARPEVVQLAGGIWQIAADLVRSVDAIVWAVNPAHDTLDRFAAYLVQSTEQFLDAAGIAMRFQIPEDLPPVPLDGTVRHSLFLAVREAENNAVKHSGCTTMTIALTPTDGLLEIVITDNGKGFDPHDQKATPDRSGLTNMRRRMEEIGGHFAIDTSIGRGTTVRLALPLPAVPPPRGPSS
jgi:signal transduction histidine kinase